MNIVDQIIQQRNIDLPTLQHLLETTDEETLEQLRTSAQQQAAAVFGHDIFIRGLVEISSHCRNNCYYCGLRRDNKSAIRYRLTDDEIISSCNHGYTLGFRTFVLQGGEDAWFDDTRLCRIVSTIRTQHPDCAITLSLGERSRASYQALFDAGANRYLLRHETASPSHYAMLHPSDMSFNNRMECLQNLKEIGYQVGCGFMVGSPHQTIEHLYSDLQFIRSFQPHMVGIGPFISTQHTPFSDMINGTAERTLRLLSIIRLMLPTVLLPATTALGTLHPQGREKGILHGANVVMPNLSPLTHRKDYNIYDNKICTGDEAAECRRCTEMRLKRIGYQSVIDRGDHPSMAQ